MQVVAFCAQNSSLFCAVQLIFVAFQMTLDQASWLNYAPGLFRTAA